jgi:hypothetical protein
MFLSKYMIMWCNDLRINYIKISFVIISQLSIQSKTEVQKMAMLLTRYHP